MPRIRTIKPEFWRNRELSKLPEFTRLVAIAVLNLADDEGFFEADPMLVRGDVFPFEDNSLRTHGALTELSRVGYLEVRRTKSKGEIGYVCNFEKHQVINRPTASKLRGLFESTNEIVDSQPLTDHSRITHGVLIEHSVLEREQGTGKGNREGNREQGCKGANAPAVRDAADAIELEVVTEWNSKMGQSCKMTPKRKQSLRSRLKEPDWVGTWRDAIAKASASDFCNGLGGNGWKADLEWFLKPDSALKLLEGRFDNRDSGSGYHLTEAQKRLQNSERAGDEWAAKMQTSPLLNLAMDNQ